MFAAAATTSDSDSDTPPTAPRWYEVPPTTLSANTATTHTTFRNNQQQTDCKWWQLEHSSYAQAVANSHLKKQLNEKTEEAKEYRAQVVRQMQEQDTANERIAQLQEQVRELAQLQEQVREQQHMLIALRQRKRQLEQLINQQQQQGTDQQQQDINQQQYIQHPTPSPAPAPPPMAASTPQIMAPWPPQMAQ